MVDRNINEIDQPTGRLRRRSLQLWRLAYYLNFVWDKLSNPWGTLDDPMRTNFYLDIWRDAAQELSVKFTELAGGFCEASMNGTSTRIYQNLVMLDHPVTMKLARDKPLVLKLLSEQGINVPAYCDFTLHNIAPAIDFLCKYSPCVVKPAHGTAGGEGVTTNVCSVRDLKRAAIFASLYGHTILVERQIPGESYRLLYLNGQLLDAIQRRSPRVIGDGTSSIRELIKRENNRRAHLNGTEGLTWLRADLDCVATLRAVGRTLKTVPKSGEIVVVKQAANDNSSRENESVPHLLCDEVIREGARAATILDVKLAGVDLITTDPGRSLKEVGGVINEVNTTPGLHYHYQVCNRASRVAVVVPILHHLLGLTEHHTASTL